MKYLVLLLLVGCGGESATVPAPSVPQPVQVDPPPTPCFRLYESLIYSNHPDLTLLGFKHLNIVDPDHDPYGVLQTDHDTVIVDWEHEISSFSDAFTWARQSGYKGPLSLYAGLPRRDYWRAVSSPDSAGYKQWQAENDAMQPFVNDVESIYPSLYTFYPDQDGWVKYAKANMAEGRRIAPTKKMYPFLWPEYHNATQLVGVEVPADYWLKQLQTIKDNADGVVIWGGWDFANNRPYQWDENAAWWQATLKFIATIPNVCR